MRSSLILGVLLCAACKKPPDIIYRTPEPEPEPEPVTVAPEPAPAPAPRGPYPTETWSETTLSSVDARVTSAGDVDGDGKADLLLGMPGEGGGTVHVVFGSTLAQKRDGQPFGFDRTLNALGASDGLGMSVAGMGDLDGDGTDDILVGAPGYDRNGQAQGGAWLILGKTLRDDPNAGIDQAWTFYYGAKGDRIGAGVASLGDLDGDGKAEAIFPGRRRAYVVRGSDLPNYETLYLVDAETWVVGAVEGVDYLPTTVPAGDIRGDGWGGALLATRGAEGEVRMLHGAQLGTKKVIDLMAEPWGTVTAPGSWVGDSLAAADLNGDGRPDPIIGWYRDQFVLSAVGAGSFVNPATTVDVGTEAFLTIEGDPKWSIASATSLGDLDGDGYDELAIGTRMESGSQKARVVVFRGRSLSGKTTARIADADAIFDYPIDAASFWWTTRVIAPGDIDGDGTGDLVVLLQGHDWQDPNRTATPKVVVHRSPWRWKATR